MGSKILRIKRIPKILKMNKINIFPLCILLLLLIAPVNILAQPIISNVTYAGFTVSWMDLTSSTGEVNYGVTTELGNIAYDVRGKDTISTAHYVNIVNLSPDTTYYFDVITDGKVDDNNGTHYTCTTASVLGIPDSDLAYGQVFLKDRITPANGAFVYITIEDVNGSGSGGQSTLLSSIVESGWWNVQLKNARETDMASYFIYYDTGEQLLIHVDAPDGCIADVMIDTADDSPALPISTTIEPEPSCEGDFDMDGDVDGTDLAVFAIDFGRTDCHIGPACEGDFDKDGDVDGSDLAVFANDFGRTDCPILK